MKKSITYLMTLLSITALASCNSAGTPVETDEANTTMMRAMANMTNMTVGSLDVTLSTDSTVSVIVDADDNDYEYADEDILVIADGSVNAKVSDLWGTTPKASLNVTINEATVNASSTYDNVEDVYVDESFIDQEINAYYDNEYLYVDLSEAADIHESLTSLVVPNLMGSVKGMVSPIQTLPLKFKGLVGSIDDSGLPDMTAAENELPSSQVDEMIEQIVPVLALMPNTTAVMVGNELQIVYQLTQEDLPELIEGFMLEIYRMMEVEIPSSLDASQQAALDAQVNEILSHIDLTLFRVEVRLDTTRNIFTYFQIQLDAVIDIADVYTDGYWDDVNDEWVEIEVPFEQTIDIDMTTTLEINAFSEPVTVTFPTDLATYTDMTEESEV